MKPKHLFYIVSVAIVVSLFSCSKEKPSIVYFPDMYYPVAYDPLQEATLAYSDSDYKNQVPLFSENNGRTALNVVPHTIYRNKEGIIPTDWEINEDKSTYNDNYNKALEVKTSPLDPAHREADLKRGKDLYEKTCAACHGDMGDGKGSIVETGAFSGVPNYKDRAITVGSVYYVIKNGRNLMGSYSGQLNMGDRWRVSEYVMEEFKK